MNLSVIASFSSTLWEVFGAPLANHLWQTTVFAGVVWLLTLLLRRNRAQARYCLWLVASAKFLLPFSLLVSFGGHLAWPKTAAVAKPRILITFEAIGQPFSAANLPPIRARAAPSMFELAHRDLPIFLLMIWSAGCVGVLLMWFLRWRRVTAAPANSGSAQPQLDFGVVLLNNLSQLVSASETRGPFQCALIQGQGNLKIAVRGELARDGIQ
jgi:bla regulator protein blaR1